MDKLFSLQTEIQGKKVAIDVYENSDLTEVGRNICIYHSLDPSNERLINELITQQLKRNLENEEYDLEWKYKLCCVLERMLDKHDREVNRTNEATTQYFKSKPQKFMRKGAVPGKKAPLNDGSLHLYDKAMKLNEKRQQMREESKKIQQGKELEECTFHPSINSTSTNSFRKRRLQNDNIYDVLYQEAISIENKKSKLRREKDQEAQLPTFAPQLNDCSIRIVELKGKEEVFMKRETPKLANKSQEFSFRPRISQESKRLVKELPNFWKKLQRNDMNYNKKPQSNCNIHQLSPAEKQCKYNGRICKTIQDQENRDPQLNKKSIEILQAKKQNLFNFIFQQLQEDGCVFAESIHHNKCLMQADQFEIIQPLLQEITSLNVELNRQEFVDSLHTLYTTLNPQDKNRLISHNIKAKWEQQHESYRNQFSFHPKISAYPTKQKKGRHVDHKNSTSFEPFEAALWNQGCEVIEEDEAQASQSNHTNRSTTDI